MPKPRKQPAHLGVTIGIRIIIRMGSLMIIIHDRLLRLRLVSIRLLTIIHVVIIIVIIIMIAVTIIVIRNHLRRLLRGAVLLTKTS